MPKTKPAPVDNAPPVGASEVNPNPSPSDLVPVEKPQPGAPALDASASPPAPDPVVERWEFDALLCRLNTMADLVWQNWGKRV